MRTVVCGVLLAVTWLSAPAHAQSVTPADVTRLSAPRSALFSAALIVGGALAGADAGMTMSCVADGRCREWNPALRPLAPHPMLYGLVKAGASTAMLTIISHYGHSRQMSTRRKALIAALVYAGVNGVIVATNVRRLR